MTNNPPTAAIMQGGAKAHFLDILKKHSTTIDIYVMSLLTIGIVFVKEIPIEVRSMAGTILGKTGIFFATIFIAQHYSWISGLLMAILSVLVLSLGPRTTAEGFQAPYSTNMKIVTDKEKWWVEKVFKENPIGIQEDNVITKAIQDNSNGSSSNSSQGGSHH